MAKKVYSFSLSDEAYKVITDIKESRNYSSTSAALEAILLNREITDDRLKKLILEVLKDNQITVTQDVKESTREEHDETEDALIDTIDDIFKSMK